MSNNFINIGKHNIYDKTEILSLHEVTEKVEVERKVIIVKFKDARRRSDKIILNENGNLANLVRVEKLNS